MKRNIFYFAIFLIFCRYPVTGQISSDNPGTYASVEEYADFLRSCPLPLDYIFSLFEEADIVVIGERDHRDTTQYTLILDILSDPRFIRDVGYVYTEVGNVNRTDAANEFIKGDYTDQESFENAFNDYYRNENYEPLWEKYNRYQFLKGLYEINRKLTGSDKITLGLTDLSFDWNGMTREQYADFVRLYSQSFSFRDSMMAVNFTRQYEEQPLRNGKRKALLITSAPHAEKLPEIPVMISVKNAEGKMVSKRDTVRTQGYFLKRRYGNNCRILAMNFYRYKNKFTPGLPVALSGEGKWDAAFELTGCKPVGFNLDGNIFGNTPANYPGLVWEDIYDGYLFYEPFYRFVCAMGIPGVVDKPFSKELVKRTAMYEYGNDRKNKARTLRFFRGFVRGPIKNYYSKFRTFQSEDITILKEQLDRVMKEQE